MEPSAAAELTYSFMLFIVALCCTHTPLDVYVFALMMVQVERVTNHDVKAIEYVLKKRFQANSELAKVSNTHWRPQCLYQEAEGSHSTEMGLTLSVFVTAVI